jgi:hypothetical protein
MPGCQISTNFDTDNYGNEGHAQTTLAMFIEGFEGELKHGARVQALYKFGRSIGVTWTPCKAPLQTRDSEISKGLRLIQAINPSDKLKYLPMKRCMADGGLG